MSGDRTFVPRVQGGGLSLTLWMTQHGVSLQQLASALGCSKSQVSRWRTDVHKPTRAFALKLEQITDGSVAASMWDAQEGPHP